MNGSSFRGSYDRVTGRKIRILTVIDRFSRFSPIVGPRFSDRAEDVVRIPDEGCAVMGYPKSIRFDRDTKFVS